MSMPLVFVINLDKSTDRMAKIAKRLDELGTSFERIPGVYGATLNDVDLNSAYSSQLNKSIYRRPLTKGEIGCYMSHQKAWQAIVDKSLPCALVVEDDILIDSNLKLFNEKLARFTESFDIVKFHCKKANPRIVDKVPIGNGYDLCRFDKVPIGNIAQLISFNGAKKLLRAHSTFGRSVDEDIQHWWEADLNVLGVFPSVVHIIQNAESDIDDQGKRKGKTNIIGVMRNIYIRIKYEYKLRTNKKKSILPVFFD